MTLPTSAAAEQTGAAAKARRQRPPWGRWAIDMVAVGGMLAAAVIGFGPSFAGPGYLAAGFGAIVIGLGVALLGALWRWGVLVVAAATVLAYFLFGGALAAPATTIGGVVPTVDTLVQLAIAIVSSWKQFLTAVAPLSAGDAFLVVPYLSTLVVAVTSGSIALRASHAAWAILPAGALLTFVIAFGMSQPALPVVQGALFVLCALAWLAFRRAWALRRDPADAGSPGSARTSLRRFAAASVVIAVALAVGGVLSAAASPAGPRYILRDIVVPPLDLREYASPMQAFRGLVRDHADDVLFTVSGLPTGARVRLATMDAYDGVVYNVAHDGSGASASFARLGDGVPATEAGTPATVTFEMGVLEGVWLPDAGYLTSVTFDGPRAEELRRSTYYNRSTGVAVVTAVLREGQTYTIDTVIPDVASSSELEDASIDPVTLPVAAGVPEGAAAAATRITAAAETPYDQATALVSELSEQGFFSHGLEGQATSRAGHFAERIQTMITAEKMVGDDEQYAVAMALLAGQVGLPARVVMGFYPEDGAGGAFEATGDDLHAWVEIAFADVGWVAFDPTPSDDRVLTDEVVVPQNEIVPQTPQPPPPPTEPVKIAPEVPEDESNDDEAAPDFGPLLAAVGLGAAGFGVLLILFGPLVAILVLKLRRRRARRRRDRGADRVSGAWDEVVDNARDLGVPVPHGGTRAEGAAALAGAFDAPAVMVLARTADARVFGPGEPSVDEIESVWAEADELVGGMRGSVGFWRRLRSRLSVRSLRSPSGDIPPKGRRRAGDPPQTGKGNAP